MRNPVRARPRYVGHELAVPEVGDFQPCLRRRGPRAAAHARRRPAGLQRLPPPPGDHAARPLDASPAATSSARCTAGPSDLQAGELIGAPHFADDPCLNLTNYPLQDWNGMLFEERHGQGRDVAAELAGLGARADLDFRATSSTASSCTSATTTGRPSSRSTSRTITSRRSIPGSAASSPATTCAGSSARHYSVQTVGVENQLGRAGSPPTAVARACWPTARASRRSTARSGSPTTRT